jgi:putative ABC transport system permease protein
MFLKLAWRNIWRNKRRTLITAASIFFAVFFAIIMRSMQLGTYTNMIEQSIEKYSGYLQLQNPEYFDDPSLNNFIEYNEELQGIIANAEGVKVAVPRIESFALASTGTQSKGVIVTGIDPELERRVSNPEYMLAKYKLTPSIVDRILAETSFEPRQEELLIFNNKKLYHDLDRLARDLGMEPGEFESYHPVFEKYTQHPGEYLMPDDKGILVSSRLATFLGAQVGDSVVLIGQGKYGASAAGIYPVRGIIRLMAPDLDNKIIYMALPAAQHFYDMNGLLTSVVMNLDNKKEMLTVQDRINAQLDQSQYVVKNWKEINPTLNQQIEGDDVSGQMFLAILYFIIFFGIIGTVMMMVAERRREFGVMVGIGMRKTKLILMVVTEMVLIGFLGTAAGMLASMPLVYNFNVNPIHYTGNMAKMYEDMGFEAVMPTAPIDNYFAAQGIIILLMVLLACLVPLRKIKKMKVINALRA